MPFDVRRATPYDAVAASALARAAKAHWGYPASWLELWADDLTISPELLSTEPAFVATDPDGSVVGICILVRTREVASIEHVWIHPDRQGHGIGRELVTRALERARESRARIVQVQSDPFAEAFYLNLGARRVGAVPAAMPGAPDRTLPLLEFSLE
jgi:ribosomal protein S18 acetylase RimI-like enzyme